MSEAIIQALRRKYMESVGNPARQLIGGGVRGYLGLDQPEYADQLGREAYANAQALSNAPGIGAPAGAFKAMASTPLLIKALRGKSLYHGGHLVENPIADKQGVLINNVPAVSFTPSLLEAKNYAMHNRPSSLYKLDPSEMNIYQMGQNKALDDAVLRGDHKALRDAGYDGFDFSSLRPQSKEVVVYDPARAAREAVPIAKLEPRWEEVNGVNVVKRFKRTEAGQKRTQPVPD